MTDTTKAPVRIWIFASGRQVFSTEPCSGFSYLRADRAALLASPEVQALLREQIEACARVAEDTMAIEACGVVVDVHASGVPISTALKALPVIRAPGDSPAEKDVVG